MLKASTIYHCASTTAYGIDISDKPRKQNRKRLDNTTYNYSAPSAPLYSYEKLNKNTAITSKK